MKRSALPFIVFIVISAFMISCTKEKLANDPLNQFNNGSALKQGDQLKKKYKAKKVPMDGQQETNPNNSAATGEFDIVYHTDTKVLELSMSWENLTVAAAAAHIHGSGAPGVNAPVVIPLTIPNEVSGTLSGSFLTTNYPTFNEENFLNGLYYINIHNSSFPAGEIRGQIVFK